MTTTYLSRTPASAGNRNTWTWSGWVKKSAIGVAQTILSTSSTGTSNTSLASLYFSSSNTLIFFQYTSSTVYTNLITTQVFRDSSAWYHIVLAYDDTQATAVNRVKFYVNGNQITAFGTSTYPAQNYSGFINQASPHAIGRDNGSPNASYFDGSMAHSHFIDGTAYDASAFGQFDANGIWTPNASPSVTYGTNGFFLDFADSTSMGNDVSGENNDFTVGGGDVTQTLDTPSDNFATANPVMVSTSNVVLTNGALTVTSNYASGWQNSGTTFAVRAGKWYWEAKATIVSASDKTSIGVVQFNTDGVNFVGNANKDLATYGLSGHGAGIGGYSYIQGDIIMCAMDLDNNKVYWGKNGTWYGTLDPSAGTGSTTQTIDNNNDCMPVVGGYGGSSWDLNFGNGYFGTTEIVSPENDSAGLGKFAYAVPAGYYALNTKNLAEFG